ncbi:uncharacterized protein J4E79_005300 [Alternaria viburni]|uniref:uncharacterized protein n=1 Tax=Alternaria viburni TaxID=566460 RepID=UPI0020C1FD4C|nr:uncharacterized protein J4E79_005300 [Alternaria viburni]KAI4660732.1 hypothetical protein J4E79_005300 [Alternaria viburni]
MYDNAELETTLSERALCGRGLKEYETGKIQTALALGRGHIQGVKNVKKWKHELLLKQADNTGSLEALTHRLNVKRLEIQPNKEPTELQKKILTSLAQGVERLRANQVVMDGTIATYDSKVARGLDRWRKAWTEVDKILAKVWTDAGRLMADDDSDADNERPPRATESKNEVGRNRGRATIPGEDVPLAAPEAEPARQRQAGRRRSDISEWQNSVQAQSPTNLDKGKGDDPITMGIFKHLRARPKTLMSICEDRIGHIRRARRRRRRRLPHHHVMSTMSPCPATRDNKRVIVTRIGNDEIEVGQAVQDANEVHLETHQTIGNAITAKVSSIGLAMKAPGG